MADDGFSWWIDRLAANLRLVDRLQIDHFRGFAAYWRVPADDDTAENGEWVEGPGKALFEAFEQAMGDLPLVAEDLEVITPDVVALASRRRAARYEGPAVRLRRGELEPSATPIRACLAGLHRHPRQ